MLAAGLGRPFASLGEGSCEDDGGCVYGYMYVMYLQ
jgi:hypothetical protein